MSVEGKGNSSEITFVFLQGRLWDQLSGNTMRNASLCLSFPLPTHLPSPFLFFSLFTMEEQHEFALFIL